MTLENSVKEVLDIIDNEQFILRRKTDSDLISKYTILETLDSIKELLTENIND
jgi:hypothetical protein